MQNRGILDVTRLPSDDTLYKLLGFDKTLSEERKDRIVRAYKGKIKYFIDFQNGAKIWSCNYPCYG